MSCGDRGDRQPRVETLGTEVCIREQPAEIRISVRALGEQNQVAAVRERDLGAGDRLDAEWLRRECECKRAVDAVFVGEREGRVAEPVRFGEDLVWRRGSIEEREGGVAMQLRILPVSHGNCMNQRPVSKS